MGAENGVTAADLVFAVARGSTKFGIWLREHGSLGALSVLMSLRLGYLAVVRVFGWLALLAGEFGRRTPRSFCATRSPALQRQVRTPKLSWADRAILAALARLMPSSHLRHLRLLISPRTQLRWHADLIKRRWAYPRRTPGRPRTAQAILTLVLEMARDNPAWTAASTVS